MSAIYLKPQEGPQTKFFATTADIAVYGGAAGGGKSYALLLEPCRHYKNPKFGGVIFRRTTTQVRNPGGLWDESQKIYSKINAKPKNASLEWKFPKGMKMKFAHLEYDHTVLEWQGSQIPFIGFDELTHFTQKQFWYMLSRNRSDSGVAGYIRATCNPDADSWVRKLIDWWIKGKDYPAEERGQAIPERSGVVRWFWRVDETMHWADTKEELYERFGQPPHCMPKSFTFIASNIYDNKILLEKDPAYLANLKSQNRVERMRLLDGNWDVRAVAGEYFKREWFPVVDAIPAGWTRVIRYWDRAATKPNENNKNPDFTAGCLMYKYADGRFLIADMKHERDTPAKIEHLVKNTASQDGWDVEIGIEQDPGSAGVADKDNYVRLLQGYRIIVSKPTKNKVTRASPLSSQAEQHNIMILRGAWNEEFFKECERFPPDETQVVKSSDEDDSGHDDQIDAASGAFNELCGSLSILDAL